jgi:hypothetical protein
MGRWNGADGNDIVEFELLGTIDDPDLIATLGFDPSGVYGSYVIYCHRNGGVGGTFEIDRILTLVEPVAPEVLRDRALARIRLPLPAPRTAPPAPAP